MSQNPYHHNYGYSGNQSQNTSNYGYNAQNTHSQYPPTHSTWGQNSTQKQSNWEHHNSNLYPSLHQNLQQQGTQQYGYQGPQKSNNTGNIFGQMLGGVTEQIGNMNMGQQQGNGNILEDVVSKMDWDTLLKDKNFSKKQADTAWVTYQERSWEQPKPSTHIQEQTDRKFAFPNPYIKYKIIPGVDQKKALDVTSKDELEKGLVKGNLIIWDYHGGPNQQFYIHRCNDSQGETQFVLINASTGFCVSAIHLTVNQKKLKGKNIENHLCVYPKLENSPAQRWRLKPMDKNKEIFQIQSVATGKVLDCEDQSHSNGTNVIQWASNKGKNQLWKILPA